MYKVLKDFADLQDNEHVYRVGDIYPRTGIEPSDERIKELSTSANKRGEVLIKEVKKAKKSKDKEQ